MDNVLKHARKLEKLVGNESIKNELSNNWLWWQLPDYREVEKEIKKELDGLSGFKKLKIGFENLDAKHCILLYGLDNF